MNTPTEHQVTIEMRPFPAVRVNGKGGRFTATATAYHAKIKALREELVLNRIKPTEKIGIKFIFPVSKSWSKKKKAENLGQPHKQKPDLDNLIKAVKDTIYNGYMCEIDDSRISEYGQMSKEWGEKGLIIITMY